MWSICLHVLAYIGSVIAAVFFTATPVPFTLFLSRCICTIQTVFYRAVNPIEGYTTSITSRVPIECNSYKYAWAYCSLVVDLTTLIEFLVFSFQCTGVSYLTGFRPVAEDTHSMAHCKRFKKIKPNFFLGLALKTCIEGNCIEKTSLYSHKASKIKGLRGVQKFSPIQPEQMFGARYDPHIP